MANYYNEEFMKECCREWQNSKTQFDYTRIYNKMRPTFYEMYRQIQNKYFPTVNDLVARNDCMTKTYLAINKYNFKFKSFSYFSNIMKNYLYDYIRKTHVEKITDFIVDTFEGEEESNYNLADYKNHEEYIDYKPLLVEQLRKYRFEKSIQNEILNEMCSFIMNFEFNYRNEIYLYLLNNGYKNTDVRKVWYYIFGYYIKEKNITEYQGNEKDENINEFGEIDYYRDDMPMRNNKSYFMEKQRKRIAYHKRKLQENLENE